MDQFFIFIFDKVIKFINKGENKPVYNKYTQKVENLTKTWTKFLRVRLREILKGEPELKL